MGWKPKTPGRTAVRPLQGRSFLIILPRGLHPRLLLSFPFGESLWNDFSLKYRKSLIEGR